MTKIAILSPHLDDAVLSCADHILFWQKHALVTVISIFTHYQSTFVPSYSQKILKKLKFSPTAYEQQRKKEDRKAMQQLNCTWEHWNLVDGGFRATDLNAHYPTAKSLFTTTVSPQDTTVTTMLDVKMKNIQNTYDVVIVPFGLGNHIDHLLTKNSAKKCIQKRLILYYLEAPYLIKRDNYSLWKKVVIACSKKSQLPMSNKKREAIARYTSQVPLLFSSSNIPSYSETILGTVPIKN
jgi:LmbE family N-acetylglucosaminyl deacetylase